MKAKKCESISCRALIRYLRLMLQTNGLSSCNEMQLNEGLKCPHKRKLTNILRCLFYLV